MDSGIVKMEKMKRTVVDRSVLDTFIRVFLPRTPLQCFVSLLIESKMEELIVLGPRTNDNTVEQTRTIFQRMHFVVGILQPNASISECQDSQQHDFRNLNNISVRQLELLRRFFPNRELYGSQGYGHLVLPDTELPDDTNKNIPYSNLPIQWLVSINSMFIALGEQYLRPNSWEVYARSIVNLRQKNLQILSQINQGLEIYFRQQEIIDIFGNCVELDSFKHVQQLLELRPFLPRCAFDEWGFISDSIDRQNRGFMSDKAFAGAGEPSMVTLPFSAVPAPSSSAMLLAPTGTCCAREVPRRSLSAQSATSP